MDLLTPRGRGGVAVLRASCAERAALFATLSSPSRGPLATAAGSPPCRALWRLAEGLEDDVLVVDRGVDGVEVHAHGSPALLDAAAATFGTLTEPACDAAEALLRDALSREQMLFALEQRQHDFDAWLRGVAGLPSAERRLQAEAAIERSRVASALARPTRVVLAGRQNAGKSTLLNRLVFCERSLAGPTPGLTRDAVAERTALAGYPFEFVDTAGEAAGAVGIDAAAIERSRAIRGAADVVLLVVDGSAAPLGVDLEIAARGALVVATKADLPQASWPPSMRPAARFAALDAASAPTIRESMGAALAAFLRLPPAGPVGGPAALDGRQAEALSLLASGSMPASA